MYPKQPRINFGNDWKLWAKFDLKEKHMSFKIGARYITTVDQNRRLNTHKIPLEDDPKIDNFGGSKVQYC